MPIYDYLCSACDHRADILHGIHDPSPQFCPSCGADGTMRKQFAAPAIHFKGSGWAKKDRGASRSTKAAAKGGEGEGGGGKDSTGGGESSSSDSSSSDASSSTSTSTPTSASSDSSSSDAPKPSTTD
ncbi:MAG TPA: zinc ribbon domain-containing protein [Candidatus Limnocylindrales bacterium]|nr:zinc ribbon domain-containing protein [Candidatus Limnocylindrales bacterium]